KLADGGLIVFHVSNRYLRLQPIVARLAQDAKLTCRNWNDDASPEEKIEGKLPSQWLVLARDEKDLGPLAGSAMGKRVTTPPETPLWTDDFSNLLSAFGKGEAED